VAKDSVQGVAYRPLRELSLLEKNRRMFEKYVQDIIDLAAML
jgi:hypothetical protein